MKGGERKEEDLKQEYTDESMMAAGFTTCQCFRGFMGMDEGDRRKGRGPLNNPG